jgi:glycosyltransferase involved in cell wall biosynthesis
VKIVHLLGWYFPDSVGGTEVYVEALCRRLRAAGQQVLVAAPDARGVAPEHYEHDGVPVFRYAIPKKLTRDEAYHRVALRGAERLHRWLADERPDILHVHSFMTGVGLPEIREARRLGIRVIATFHLPGLGYMCRTGELMQWGAFPCDGIVIPDKCGSCTLTRFGLPQMPARILGLIPPAIGVALRHLPGRLGTAVGMSASIVEYQQQQREMFDLVERVVVLNQTAYGMLVSNGSPAGKIVINRLGIGQTHIVKKAEPHLKPTRAPVRFGFLGRLHLQKGLYEIVRAVLAIPRDVRFQLDIRGPMLDEGARALVTDLKRLLAGDPRVRFEPGVAPSDVPAVLAEFDVLICPSLWFENGPTVALEAMAVGTPIIATRVGNLGEIVEDGVNGRLVKAGDVEALSRALLEAATSPAVTIDRWRSALTSSRTMDDVALDYLKLYRGEESSVREGASDLRRTASGS